MRESAKCHHLDLSQPHLTNFAKKCSLKEGSEERALMVWMESESGIISAQG